MPPDIDVSGITPAARAIVRDAAVVYARHAGDALVGIVAKGSAVKGDYIEGCSDVDLHVYVRDEALGPDGKLPFERTVAVHRELARIDVAPFAYIQGYVKPPRLTRGWVGPIPGAYHVVAGVNPLPEATADELRASAERHLAALDPVPPYLKDSLLDWGDGRLPRLTRLLVTADVWPVLYELIIVRGGEPIATWNLHKPDAVAALPASEPAGRAARAFLDALRAYYPAQDSVDRALTMIEHGVTFLRAARAAAGLTTGN